jgi:hypothetical protein
MRKILLIPLTMIILSSGCLSINLKAQIHEGRITKQKPGCYAELSIKEGGTWKDRKYEGGSFKNAQSLKLPKEHTDHSFYIRYEGPGWESEKIGYRLYLDWRNAIDIFGKVNDSLVLAGVGQDGFESYHNQAPWGQDIFKVGDALGIGSIGRWVDDKVLHFNEVDSTFASVSNSKSESVVNINYYGWKTGDEKINITSHLSISPGNHHTKHTITPSKSISGICTGIINHKVEFFKKESDNKKWAYIATYGVQTLIPDQLGLAIFYKTSDAEKAFEGDLDHLVMFKPTTKPITFYFLAAWEKEENGIKTKVEFEKYLDKLLSKLNSKNKI